jgi:hypothetical protein
VFSALGLAAAAVMLAASSVLANGVLDVPQIWVAVGGEVVSSTGESLVLEIGGRAWRLTPGGGGVASATADQPGLVRVVRPSDCRTLIEFIALPDSMHVLTFDPSGEISAETWRGSLDAGPSLADEVPTDCPLEPLESASGETSGNSWLIFLLGSSAVLALGAGAFILGRRPRPAG